jgi:acetylglutamate kinase
MIPKVQSACLGIQKGIQEIDILNGKIGLSLKNGTRILK